MNIAVIDADLIGRKKHRFPNLACMKISGYHKKGGNYVELKLDYGGLDQFDKVYISKVFTDTPLPIEILELPNVTYGGTGFYFDNAPALPCEIEHSFPDYHLYDEFIAIQTLLKGVNPKEFKEYTDYSIGFLTRGCFRKCPFCVNKKYDHVFQASPLQEFYDPERPKICMLDDNVFGYPKWKELFEELQATGKKFKFKQGMDERILTHDKAEALFSSKYDGDITFAFDNIADYDLIERKLQLIRETTHTICKFYVLCGFDYSDQWDDGFWLRDIIGVFKRIELLGRYACIPYVMRFNRYESAPDPYRGIYVTLARWINQPSYFKKETFDEYVHITDWNSGGKSSSRYFAEFERLHPEVAQEWFYKKFWVPVEKEAT